MEFDDVISLLEQRESLLEVSEVIFALMGITIKRNFPEVYDMLEKAIAKP